MPSDEITVHYHCQPEGEYLASVIQAHTDFILGTTKAPLLPYPVPKSASIIIAETTQVRVDPFKTSLCFLKLDSGHNMERQKNDKNGLLSFTNLSITFWGMCVCFFQLKGSDLELTIVKGSSVHQASLNGPACAYVNARVKVGNRELGRKGAASMSYKSNDKKNPFHLKSKQSQTNNEKRTIAVLTVFSFPLMKSFCFFSFVTSFFYVRGGNSAGESKGG